jgi:hypothetical protein
MIFTLRPPNWMGAIRRFVKRFKWLLLMRDHNIKPIARRLAESIHHWTTKEVKKYLRKYLGRGDCDLPCMEFVRQTEMPVMLNQQLGLLEFGLILEERCEEAAERSMNIVRLMSHELLSAVEWERAKPLGPERFSVGQYKELLKRRAVMPL